MKIKATHLEMVEATEKHGVKRGVRYDFYMKDICVGSVGITKYTNVNCYQYQLNCDVIYKGVSGSRHTGCMIHRNGTLTNLQIKQHMARELNDVICSLEKERVALDTQSMAIQDSLMNLYFNTPIDDEEKKKRAKWVLDMKENK